MSLTNIMSTSNDIVSINANVIPPFPSNKGDFDDWRMVMQAYLDARGLWSGVCNVDSKSVSSSSLSSPTEDSDKSKKAFSILLQSFGKKQLNNIKTLPAGDALAVWNKIISVYGIVKTTESRMSLLEQLKNIKKLRKESVEDYVARIDRIIYDLQILNEIITSSQRKYYIIEGLLNLDE